MRCAVVGTGRMGNALVAASSHFEGPFGRGFNGTGFDAVLLAVPDGQIADAAALISPGTLVGHCSGAMGLAVLAPREAFGLHPLMTVTAAGGTFVGAGAAVAGTNERARAFARELADALGMRAYEIHDEDRAAYHAAASIASNFLVTLEDAADTLLATTGAPRSLLVPLVRASLENWATLGGAKALTGPIARGDHATVARQREAVAARTPELVALFDAMVRATEALAQRRD